MKTFGYHYCVLSAFCIASVSGQNPTEACPATIVDEGTCLEACGTDTNNDPGAANFIVLADSMDGKYTYSGFSCECEESDPGVFCKYEYTFPTCQDSNVTDCGGDACSTFCSSLGFTAQEDQEGYTCIADSGVVSCQCATEFLTSDGTPESNIYVCGDPGFENDPSGAIVVTTSMGIIGMLVPAVFALLLDL
jgi:hypothetical protein